MWVLWAHLLSIQGVLCLHCSAALSILQGIKMPACFHCGLKPSKPSLQLLGLSYRPMHNGDTDSLMQSNTRLACFCCPCTNVLCHAVISAVIYADSIKNGCAVLCCAVLCCAVLCCAVLCCAVLCCAALSSHVWTAFCCACIASPCTSACYAAVSAYYRAPFCTPCRQQNQHVPLPCSDSCTSMRCGCVPL